MIRELKEIKIKEINENLNLVKERDKLINAIRPKALDIPQKRYNFFEKYLFKRKDYKENLKKINDANQKEIKEKEEIRNRINNINKKLIAVGYLNDEEARSQIEQIQKSTTLEGMGISSLDEAISLLDKNDIDIQFDSFDEGFKIAPEIVGSDLEFMKAAVKEDLKYIKYDKTENPELYIQTLDLAVKKIDDMELPEYEFNYRSTFESYKEELISPKDVEQGRYKVPHKYMFEEIRQEFAKDEFYTPWSASFDYLSVDGKFLEEFGKEMQGLYEDKSNLLAVHGFAHGKYNSDHDKEKRESIFRNGLKNSLQNSGASLRDIKSTAFVQNNGLNFINALNYSYNAETVIVLTLPSDSNIPIWGTDEKDINGVCIKTENYILPEYVYGAFNCTDEDRKIEKNNIEKKKKYKYHYYDARISEKEGCKEDIETVKR